MRVSGIAGDVRVGGREAAALVRWSYEGTRDGWVVAATASRTDPFWLDGSGPFALRLQVGTAVWKWPGVRVRAVGTEVTIAGEGAPAIDG